MDAETRLEIASLAPLFCDKFQFGVGTAAYQIEGAAGEGGRSDSVWDVFCRRPGAIRNGDTGDTACDHYRRWAEDIDWLRVLGVEAYRFSISWPRVLPDSSGVPNELGFEFYQRLVDALVDAGIRPMVTLHHWDLPQYLQEQGGWQNRQTAAAFAEFAGLVAERLGRAVDFYSTINEPWCIAFLGHRSGVHAPGIQDEDAAFRVAHHLLLAHGLGVRQLRDSAPHAEVGIVLNGGLSHGATVSTEDQRAAKLAEDEQIHLFVNALLERRYPSSQQHRFGDAVLPGDLDIIGANCDYLGWNYYTRNVVRADSHGSFEFTTSGDYPVTDIGWEIYPDGLRELMTALDSRYELPPLYITENGGAFDDRVSDGVVSDSDRIAYMHEHLRAVADLVSDGFDIRGYVGWSLMDNFEWAEGYSRRFGLLHIDYETQRRTLKDSGKFFARIMDRKRQQLINKDGLAHGN